MIVLLWHDPVVAAESWAAERFQVFTGAPILEYGEDTDTAAAEETEYFYPTPPDGMAEQLELAFNEAGQWLRDKGFPEPLMRPIVQTENGPAYRIYLCDRAHNTCPSEGLGWYSRYCADESGRAEYLGIPWQNVLDDDRNITHLGYQTPIHELMHAIMANSTLGFSIADDCSRDNPWHWISEGIPDAISFDVLEVLKEKLGLQFTPDRSGRDMQKVFGSRRYDVPLPSKKYVDDYPGTCADLDKGKEGDCLQSGYFTSSFWRYVERAHDSGLTYSYLLTRDPEKPGLLDIPVEGRQSWTRDVRWVNEGLRNRTGYRLDFLYSLFIADFALRVPPSDAHDARMAAANTPAEEEAATEKSLENWLKILFPSGCKEINLSLQDTSASVNLTIEPMAATCIWVNEFNLPGLSQIAFLSGHDDRSLLEDISVVRAGSSVGVIGGEPVALPNQQYQYYATWKGFLHDSTERTLYIVTNIARNPGRTIERTFDLVVTLPTMGNSALATVPLPFANTALPKQKPTFKPRSKTLDKQRAETQKFIARQMAQDKDSLTANVESAVEVSRSPNQPPCAEPFRYAPCGPYLQINLQLRPGTWAMPSQTTGAGGMAAQFFGGLQAMSSQLGSDIGEEAPNIEARLDRIDGSFVGISFPLVDYGFSGSFDNASISVSMAGGELLSAIGPPDATGWPPLRGQVTIEEYSPFRIAGSFVAPLAELLPNGDEPPIFTPRVTVTGFFNSVAPFQSDERAQWIQPSVEEIAEDLGNTLGVSGDVMEMLEEAGAFSGGNAASGQGSGAVNEAPPECDCSCEAEPDATDFCRLVCDLEYEACE